MSVKKEEKVFAFFREDTLDPASGGVSGEAEGVSSLLYEGAVAAVLCRRLGAVNIAGYCRCDRKSPFQTVEAIRLCRYSAIRKECLYPGEAQFHCQ